MNKAYRLYIHNKYMYDDILVKNIWKKYHLRCAKHMLGKITESMKTMQLSVNLCVQHFVETFLISIILSFCLKVKNAMGENE